MALRGNFTFTGTRVPKKVDKLVQEAMIHKLHMGNNGVMQDWYSYHLNEDCGYHTIDTVVVAKDESGKPIGAAVTTSAQSSPNSAFYTYSSDISVYVKSRYRKHGVGTELYKKTMTLLKRWDMIEDEKHITISPHDQKSHKFYRSLGRYDTEERY